MPEENGNVAVVPEGAVTPAETPKMFDSEGNFAENWTQLLSDETLRDNPTLKASKTVEALASQTVNAQKMVGANTIIIPSEASNESEWDAFHKAGGRPETADDYAFARPEELPEEYYHPDRAKVAQELMHKLGLSKKQADALHVFNNDYVIAELKQQTQDDKMALQSLEDGLHADWGNAFEQKKHFGNLAIEEGTLGDEEFKQRIVAKYSKDPDIVRLLGNLGNKFSEAGSPNVPLIPTTGDIQNEIDKAMAHKAHGLDFKQHGFTKSQHDAQVEKVSQLFLKKHPKGK